MSASKLSFPKPFGFSLVINGGLRNQDIFSASSYKVLVETVKDKTILTTLVSIHSESIDNTFNIKCESTWKFIISDGEIDEMTLYESIVYIHNHISEVLSKTLEADSYNPNLVLPEFDEIKDELSHFL